MKQELEKEEHSTNFISEEDFEKLLGSIPNYTDNQKLSGLDWRMLFRIMYSCALRIKEVTEIKRKDIDLDTAILTLHNTKTGWKHCKCSKWKDKKLASSDKKCKKCYGSGWIRVIQKTTILLRDIQILKLYLIQTDHDLVLFPVSRQSIWKKFKKMCNDSGLHYRWEKDQRVFKDNPYLLRSSREKIMEQLGAPNSIMDLKMRHKPKTMGDVYRAVDIHALLSWERNHYTT
jgi:integrase